MKTNNSEAMNVKIGEESVSIRIFGTLGENFVFGFGMMEDGVGVLVKAKRPLGSEDGAALDVDRIYPLRRNQAGGFAKYPYNGFHGGTNVHNFLDKHWLPIEAKESITSKFAALLQSYPKPVLTIDIPK